MKSHGLIKEERISSNIEIDKLFESGCSFISYPLRVIYITTLPKKDENISILVSVSKRKFKHAVDRNRMKRLIKETYRLNKSGLIESVASREYSLMIAFLYLDQQLCTYQEMEKAMKKALVLLNEKLP